MTSEITLNPLIPSAASAQREQDGHQRGAMLDLGCGLDREEQAELGPAPSLRHGKEGLLTRQLFGCG